MLLISLMLVGLLSGGVSAEAKTAVSAPLSPAFVAYMEGLNAETITSQSATVHQSGHIPVPVERYLGESDQLTTAAALPAAYDLRVTGRITEVRDQDPYGSC